MSTTWLDTPGSTLPTRDDAIDFVASGAPGFVSVRFTDTRIEEIAYRDGAFVYPYLASTRTDLTFALRRTGGWPRGSDVARARVFVGGSAVTVFPLPTWKLLYGVDFTTILPIVNYPGPGTYTIDGKTWYLKESNVSAVDMQPYLNVGLGWFANPATYGGAVGDLQPDSAINYPHWFMPLSQVPGYDESIPICVRVRPPGYWGCGAGITSSTNDTARRSAADGQYDALALRSRNQGVGGKFGNNWPQGGSPVYSDAGMAMLSMPSPGRVHYVAQHEGGATAFPGGPSTLTLGSPTSYAFNQVSLPRPNPGILLMAWGGGMPGYPTSIRALEIWGFKS